MKRQENINLLIEHRKKIEDLIDLFSRYVETGGCKKIIVDVFHKISFYTNDFLLNEKLLLENKNAERFEKLQKYHNEFANKMIDFQKDYENQKPGLCKELLNFLNDWYSRHILYFDNNITKNN